jgi:hypothetical protein
MNPAVFSSWSVPRDYKKDEENRSSLLSFETPACHDMGLVAEELSEASELISAVQWSWKSGCEEKTLYVQLKWDCYSSCVNIRYQETTSGECNILRTLVCVCVCVCVCNDEL